MKSLFIAFFLTLSSILFAQDAPRTLSNADVVSMTKSGVAGDTIVLLIQHSSAKFDTSPEALIELKKSGVSDAVLNAMLSATPKLDTPRELACRDSQLMTKALSAFGSPEKLGSIHSIRMKFNSVPTAANGATSENERVTVYPDQLYVTSQAANGVSHKIIVTPDFGYQTTGNMESALPAAALDELRSQMKNEATYIYQHIDGYTCTAAGTEQISGVTSARLVIKRQGGELQWNIDPATGRLLRSRTTGAASGEIVVDSSDWRTVDGLNFAFKRHVLAGARSNDLTLTSVELNPAIDHNLFVAPSKEVSAGFTFKVLQSESVPYIVQTGGGVSTNCQISGSTSTSFSSYTSGNSTFGTANSTPDLRMNCNTSETSFKWQHVLNAMLVEASDGNAYIIACDRAWRWSKCSGLKPGDTFNARRSDKGFVVQFFNTKEKEKEATYTVLQAKSMR
jgi:hypothetical protein